MDALSLDECSGVSEIGKEEAIDSQGATSADFEKTCYETAGSEPDFTQGRFDDSQSCVSEELDRTSECLEGAVALPVINLI